MNFMVYLEGLNIPIYDGNKIFSIYCNEKTPSMVINFQKNLFYCNKTKKGGDIVKFCMDYEKMNFFEAVDTLVEISWTLYSSSWIEEGTDELSDGRILKILPEYRADYYKLMNKYALPYWHRDDVKLMAWREARKEWKSKKKKKRMKV